MESVEIKSAKGEASLYFHPGDGTEDFWVELKDRNLSAKISINGFGINSFSNYFKNLAENWKGLKEKSTCFTLEGEFTLSATSDKLGHIFLIANLTSDPNDGWDVSFPILMEAGQLHDIAERVTYFFERSPN